MPSKRPCVVGLGEILWDMLPSGTFLGGAPANFAFHANELGAHGVVVSAVGQDDLGQRIVDQLQQLNVSTAGLRQTTQPTGTVTVTTVAGQPNYVIHTDVAWDFIPFDTALRDLASQTDAVCFGTLAQRCHNSRESIRSFLQATGKHCWRIFDINLRQQFYDASVIRSSLELAHVLKLNHEELPIVAQLMGINATAEETIQILLQSCQLRLIALTRGGSGSSLYTRWRTSHHPGYPVSNIADTVGAGDSFTAALVMGLLNSDDLDSIHDRAARIASYVCTQRGATPQLPDELRSRTRK